MKILCRSQILIIDCNKLIFIFSKIGRDKTVQYDIWQLYCANQANYIKTTNITNKQLSNYIRYNSQINHQCETISFIPIFQKKYP